MRPSFYSSTQFPKLAHLATNWETIRDEFKALQAPTLTINRVGKSLAQLVEEVDDHMRGGGEYGWIWGWGDNMTVMPEWTQYALMAFDRPVEYARSNMPRTMSLLEETGGIKLCALLRLEPNVFLGTHAHTGTWEEGLLHLQLTIDAPLEKNFAYLNVNGQFNHSTNGNLVIFDGSLDHFAVNASRDLRTVLYMEFFRERHMLA